MDVRIMGWELSGISLVIVTSGWLVKAIKFWGTGGILPQQRKYSTDFPGKALFHEVILFTFKVTVTGHIIG
jgi:hypothetical protein